MSPINCARCGSPNGPDADSCERCGARFVAGGAGVAAGVNTPGAPRVLHPAGALAAGRLPIDFPSVPFQSVGDALRPTLQLYRENFLLVGKILLAATVPLVAAQHALSAAGGSWALGPFAFVGLASVVVNSLTHGALVYAVVTLLRTGASPTLAESYAWGLGKWRRLLLCSLMMNVLTALGYKLLVIPGLVLSTMFAVALPALVIENRGPVSALKRSAQLTKGNRLLILFTSSLLSLAVYVATWLTGARDAADAASVVYTLVYAAANQMITSAHTVLSLFIYLGIRADKGETLSVYDAPPAPAAVAAPN